MNKKLSVIIPCYNGENYISIAIKSVLNLKSECIELIVVNDGSVDGTKEICESIDDSRLTVITVSNGGTGRARNIGIESSCGDWIIFLDSDDLLISNSITDFYFSLLDKYYALGIDIICTPRIKTDMNLLTKPNISYPESIKEVKHHIPYLEFWTCIYRRNYLKDYNIRFYEYRDQDIESAFRYLSFSYTKNIIINNSMYFYLQRTNLFSNTHTWNKYKLSYIKALVYVDILKNRALKEDTEYLIVIVIKSLIYFYLISIKYGYSASVDLENIHDLVKQINIIANSKSKLLMELNLLDSFRNLLRIRKTSNTSSSDNSILQKKIDDQHILDNLELISSKLKLSLNK